MLKASLKISIFAEREFTFTSAVSVDIFKSADSILDSCKIVLPARVKFDGKFQVPKLEQYEIIVQMGYDDILETVFHGFVMYLQSDSKITLWCSGLLAKYKYLTLHESSDFGFHISHLLKSQGIEEPIFTDMRDAPWNFELMSGTVFGLLEKLQRLRIHSSLIFDADDNPMFVLSRRYVSAIDRGRKFSFGKNIIDFKDAVVKHDLPDDIQSNIDASIVKLLHVSDAKGNPDSLEAVIQCSFPEWRGRRVDLTFWGISWDRQAQEEANDAALRASVIRGNFELSQLSTFGCNFVQPYESVHVDYNNDTAGDYIVVSNHISYGLGGVRQFIKLF